MKRILVGLLLIANSAAFAEKCYQVTAKKNLWSRSPELLCVNESQNSSQATITLKISNISETKVIASYNLDLYQRVRCMECNQDIFKVTNPENTSFADITTIKFDGALEIINDAAVETGTVKIGSKKLYYRSMQ
jgi:hypothetical protein